MFVKWIGKLGFVDLSSFSFKLWAELQPCGWWMGCRMASTLESWIAVYSMQHYLHLHNTFFQEFSLHDIRWMSWDDIRFNSAQLFPPAELINGKKMVLLWGGVGRGVGRLVGVPTTGGAKPCLAPYFCCWKYKNHPKTIQNPWHVYYKAHILDTLFFSFSTRFTVSLWNQVYLKKRDL